ncbi:BtuB Outer membrane cobalamin receptor protein [Methylophilaceae bacterium]
MKKLVLLGLCISSLSSLSFADNIEINPVVVTSSRQEQRLSDVMTSVSVITRADIDRLNPQDIVSAIQGEPGIEFVRLGGLGLQTSIFMRGSKSSQVLVLVDGLMLSDEFTNSIPIQNIPIDQVEKIEILRGNASALYGPRASGGVIQIFTKAGRGNSGSYASATYGSRDTKNVSAGYSGKEEATSFNLSIGHQETNGFATFNPAQNNLFPSGYGYATGAGYVANPTKNKYESNSLLAGLSKIFLPGQEVGFKILASEMHVLSDIGSNVNYTAGYLSSDGYNYLDKLNSKNLFTQIYSKNEITNYWNSKVSLGASNVTNEFDYNYGQSGVPLGYYNTQQTNFSWTNDFVINNTQSILLGVESNKITTKDEDPYFSVTNFSAKRITNSIFTGYSAKFDAIGVQLNARHDNISSGQSANTGLFGLSYDLSKNWKLAGSISNAFTPPSSAQLFSGPVSGGNPDLKTERDRSTEASIQYSNTDALIRLVAFQKDSTNLIAASGYTSSDPICLAPICRNQLGNIGKAKNNGVEISAKTAINNFHIKLATTFQNSINEDNNTRLIRQAKNFGSLDINYVFDNWNLGTQFFISGNRSDTNFNISPSESVILGGYTLVNLSASYQYDKNWAARLKVDNLMDRSYQQAYSYNTPGFGAFLTLQYTP